MVGIVVPGHDWPVTVAGYAEQVNGAWHAIVDICFENIAPQCVQSVDHYPDADAAFDAAKSAAESIGAALCGGRKPRGLTSIPGGRHGVH